MIHEYLIAFLVYVSVYLILVISLNLTFGFTGLVNLGHMVSFGIGAYMSAILTLHSVPWYLAIFLSGLFASFLGTIIAAITVRLKGDYFQIVTLGLVFIAIALSRNWISVTRGALGIPRIPGIFKSHISYLIFASVTAIITITVIYFITKSETGKIFQAIRDDETGAMILGKNTYIYKILAIAISTFFAGIGGSVYVHFIKFVDPSVFDLEFFVIILLMLIVGGLSSIKGSIIGVFLVALLSDGVRFVVVRPDLIGPVRNMILMGTLLFMLIYKPRGIFGKVDI